MRKSSSIVVILILTLVSMSVSAGIDVSLSADKDGLTSFHLAISEHFEVEQKTVVVVREQKIPDEDIPVVFFLAEQAGVAPSAIVKLRLGGKSWIDIALHFNQKPDLFYVPLTNPGPPYGKALGHYKNHKREQWSEIRLSDSEIVALVNLKFLSLHYGYSADEIARMRSEDKSFITINATVKEKQQAKQHPVAEQTKNPAKAKGKKKPR